MIYQKLVSFYLHKVCYYVCTAVICCALTEDIAAYSEECYTHEDMYTSPHRFDRVYIWCSFSAASASHFHQVPFKDVLVGHLQVLLHIFD